MRVGHILSWANMSRHQIVATVSVSNPLALWEVANNILTGVSDLSVEDVVELIGPREDPAIEACLVSLISSPDRIPGSSLDELLVSPTGVQEPERIFCDVDDDTRQGLLFNFNDALRGTLNLAATSYGTVSLRADNDTLPMRDATGI
jgi:hypothetical protein